MERSEEGLIKVSTDTRQTKEKEVCSDGETKGEERRTGKQKRQKETKI